jgi:hypothetical protein
MPMEPLPDLAALSLPEIVRLVEQRRLPPVDQWNPAHCGDSEMRIARDGTWFHQGSPIGRPAMVRLFSTVLRIEVEDAPFVATAMKVEGSGAAMRLAFQLNTGDLVTAGEAHPLRFAGEADAPRPYLHVRGGLEALVARPVYYELADLALAGDGPVPGVWSDGVFFPVAAA